MIKVFLAEDEQVIRNGIKRRIAWEENGFCFAGEAGDGETAYAKILEVKPDILITDVTMPFMNGLELSELVKKELPDIKIIIISGFDQFIFASRALRIGVTDYLMKPVDARKLLATLLEAKQALEEERRQKRYIELLKQEMGKKERMKRGIFLGKLILGRYDWTEIMDKSRALHMDLSAKVYNLILFQYWKEEQKQREMLREKEIEEKLAKLLEHHTDAIYFDRGTEGGAILWKGAESQGADKRVKGLVHELEEVLKGRQGIQYFIGVGQETKSLRDISECYQEANRVFAGRFFANSNCVIFADDVKELWNGEEAVTAGQTEDLDLRKVDKERIQNFLKHGNRSDVPAFAETYCRQLGRGNIQSLLFRQYVLMDCSLAAIHFLEKIGGDAERLEKDFSDTGKISENAVSVERTKQYLSALLDLCMEIRDGIAENRSKLLLERGKEYMEEHYGDEDISLNTVAAYVNVSPNHFSRIFSQQEEKTFVEYLTELRMNRAKEMLRCTGLKATEISRRLGYKDHHYFYYLFKKTVGCTPGDYRMKNVG